MAKSVDNLLLPESSELCRKIALGLDVSTIIGKSEIFCKVTTFPWRTLVANLIGKYTSNIKHGNHKYMETLLRTKKVVSLKFNMKFLVRSEIQCAVTAFARRWHV